MTSWASRAISGAALDPFRVNYSITNMCQKVKQYLYFFVVFFGCRRFLDTLRKPSGRLPGLRASGLRASGPPGLRASGPPGLRPPGLRASGLRASGPPASGPPGLRPSGLRPRARVPRRRSRPAPRGYMSCFVYLNNPLPHPKQQKRQDIS